MQMTSPAPPLGKSPCPPRRLHLALTDSLAFRGALLRSQGRPPIIPASELRRFRHGQLSYTTPGQPRLILLRPLFLQGEDMMMMARHVSETRPISRSFAKWADFWPRW